MTYGKPFHLATDIKFADSEKTARHTTLNKIHKLFAANEGMGKNVITDRSDFPLF